jgi:ammonium transporter, Amt family
MRNGASWRRIATCVAATVIGMTASPALAQTKIDGADTAWMIAATAPVLMMTIPGLALFYAGMVRKKNVLATMVQSVAATALVSILWALAGYSLAFSGDGALIGTLSRTLFSIGIDSVNPAAGTIPEAVFLVYQMTFAIITVALVAGSVADRMRFSAFLSFSIGWLLIVYVPVAHWVWGGGFLGSLGLLDFAGGTVVHINAGIAGLVAALVLGSRHGYGSENLAPYDLSMAVIGTGLLWVGWFGFNGGSARRRIARGDGDPCDPPRRLRGRFDLDGARVAQTRAALGPGHHLGRHRGARDHHACFRFRAAVACRRHRDFGRPRLFLGLHPHQAPVRLR